MAVTISTPSGEASALIIKKNNRYFSLYKRFALASHSAYSLVKFHNILQPFQSFYRKTPKKCYNKKEN